MAVYIVLDLIALIGTTKSSRWPLIGWIVLEFIRIFSMMICTIIAIIIWAVYMDDSKDTSYMIAVAVIGMMLISMLFKDRICILFFCHSHSHSSHSHSALCNVYPVALDRNTLLEKTYQKH